MSAIQLKRGEGGFTATRKQRGSTHARKGRVGTNGERNECCYTCIQKFKSQSRSQLPIRITPTSSVYTIFSLRADSYHLLFALIAFYPRCSMLIFSLCVCSCARGRPPVSSLALNRTSRHGHDLTHHDLTQVLLVIETSVYFFRTAC